MVLYEETLEDIKDFENFKNKLSDSLKYLYDDIDFSIIQKFQQNGKIEI